MEEEEEEEDDDIRFRSVIVRRGTTIRISPAGAGFLTMSAASRS